MFLNLREDEREELEKIFKDLIHHDPEAPADPIDPLTYRTPEGDSGLHIAAFRGDCRAVQLLLAAGLDVNQAGDAGYTALHYACLANHKDVVRLLLSNGASRIIRNEFDHPPLIDEENDEGGAC